MNRYTYTLFGILSYISMLLFFVMMGKDFVFDTMFLRVVYVLGVQVICIGVGVIIYKLFLSVKL